MADWFKFYENDIDEMRLQWAIGEAAEVLPVWIALLSEACRHKDGTLSGYCEDFELFALAKRINISVPKVNQGIELLVKINYLKRMADKTLCIRKWDEKQSEYCQRKTRLQNQTGDNHHTKRTKNSDSVPTVSEHCPDSVRQEEKRGEERRTEEAADAAITMMGKKTTKQPSKFVWMWCVAYKEVFGKEYMVTPGKDEKASDRLTGLRDATTDDLIAIAKKAWAMPDGFNTGQAVSISGFASRFNEIRKDVGSLKGAIKKRPSMEEYEAAERASLKAGGQ